MESAGVRCAALHTGGVSWLDVTVTVGPRLGPLVRWLGAGWGLELGQGLAPALEALGVDALPDGRRASGFWLSLEGERPAGTSADLVIAASVLLRSGQAAELTREGAPAWVVTGSGCLGLDAEGRPSVEAVSGWPEKIRALSARLAGLSGARALLLHPAAQGAEVVRALEAEGLSERVTLAPVQDPGGLERALRPVLGGQAWRPAGWPAPSPEVERVLERARAYAEQMALGYVGVELVALVLVETGAAGPALNQLRWTLSPAQLRPALQGVVLTGDPSEPQPTPRLIRTGARLHPGFSLEALATALVQDARSVLHVIAGRDLGLGLSVQSVDNSFETARGAVFTFTPCSGVFEVLGGPEDGRWIRPSPGETIGRWAPEGGPGHGLYRESCLKDRLLSRAHITSNGGGRVLARQGVRTLVAGLERPIGAGQTVELNAGDILKLTPFTWLLACGDEPQE